MSEHDRNRERTKAELAVLERLKKACGDLKEITEERDGFGHTTLKVGKKSLAILGDHDGTPVLSLKTDVDTQSALIKRGKFTRTPYVGQHGWVSIRGPVKEIDWAAVKEIITDTYRAVAPKRLLKDL
jgi:hypothetical protein